MDPLAQVVKMDGMDRMDKTAKMGKMVGTDQTNQLKYLANTGTVVITSARVIVPLTMDGTCLISMTQNQVGKKTWIILWNSFEYWFFY